MAKLSDIPIRKRSRQRYSVEYKRRLVEETLQKNTSAASVALAHGINANLLLRWRREYEMGEFGPVSQAAFVPVAQRKLTSTDQGFVKNGIGRTHTNLHR